MHQAIHFRKQYNWLRFYSITICVPFIHVHFSIDSIIFREMWDWIDLLWRVKQKQCDTLHIDIIPYACAVYCYCASNMVSRQSLLSAMSRKMYIHTRSILICMPLVGAFDIHSLCMRRCLCDTNDWTKDESWINYWKICILNDFWETFPSYRMP